MNHQCAVRREQQWGEIGGKQKCVEVPLQEPRSDMVPRKASKLPLEWELPCCRIGMDVSKVRSLTGAHKERQFELVRRDRGESFHERKGVFVEANGFAVSERRQIDPESEHRAAV
jgi:hypothetical protein